MARQRNTDKIDIHLQTKLSDNQCDVATAIWRKYGVFDNESNISPAIRKRFQEEVVWSITFFNYDINSESDCNKMKRFTTEIMNRYRQTIDLAGVDRIDYRKNNDSWCVICKPDKSHGIRKYGRSVCTAATNFVKAENTNEGFELGHKTAMDLLQKIEVKTPNLIDRATMFAGIREAIEHKQLELNTLIENMNGPDALPDLTQEDKAKAKADDEEVMMTDEEIQKKIVEEHKLNLFGGE